MISKNTRYVLLDPDGDIRGSSPDIEGISSLRAKNRWGKIYECSFDGRKLLIGKEVK